MSGMFIVFLPITFKDFTRIVISQAWWNQNKFKICGKRRYKIRNNISLSRRIVFSEYCLNFSLFHWRNSLIRNHFTSFHATKISPTSTTCARMFISGSFGVRRVSPYLWPWSTSSFLSTSIAEPKEYWQANCWVL